MGTGSYDLVQPQTSALSGIANDQRPTTNVLNIWSAPFFPKHSLEKLRISSVEPMDWSDELIALVASSPRIAKHAHVPLQSGQRRRASPHASQISPLALSREDREDPRRHARPPPSARM